MDDSQLLVYPRVRDGRPRAVPPLQHSRRRLASGSHTGAGCWRTKNIFDVSYVHAHTVSYTSGRVPPPGWWPRRAVLGKPHQPLRRSKRRTSVPDLTSVGRRRRARSRSGGRDTCRLRTVPGCEMCSRCARTAHLLLAGRTRRPVHHHDGRGSHQYARSSVCRASLKACRGLTFADEAEIYTEMSVSTTVVLTIHDVPTGIASCVIPPAYEMSLKAWIWARRALISSGCRHRPSRFVVAGSLSVHS
ncbi:hypothetical protein V8D89_003717 [Ganoderma adspersum]